MNYSECYADEVSDWESDREPDAIAALEMADEETLESQSNRDFWADMEAATEAGIDLHDEIAFEHYLTDLRDPDYPNGDLL